ncbi:MAG: hypothetical protein CMJ80_11155, partial [Planctomycetaceae bacterium]|nr:hypothetical protein [Planctomycetaceae bacterium]
MAVATLLQQDGLAALESAAPVKPELEPKSYDLRPKLTYTHLHVQNERLRGATHDDGVALGRI